MVPVILAGWREGLQKIALTHLQQELLGLSLKEAKENVDYLSEAVENELQLHRPVVLKVPNGLAPEFMRRADELGALVGVVNMGISPAHSGKDAVTQQAA